MTITTTGILISVLALICLALSGGLMTLMGTQPKDPESPGWKPGCCAGTCFIVAFWTGIIVTIIGLFTPGRIL